MLEKSFPSRGSNSFNLCDYIRGQANIGGVMRFGLRCIFTLAILYRAILLSQGGAGTAALSSQMAEAVPMGQARMRDEIALRLSGYCRDDPAACLSNAARLTNLVAAGGTDEPIELRHPRHGAIAASTR